jgi:signal transduction histidine kinase
LINDFVQAGLPVTLGTEGERGLVSAAVGLALYRITQESLANIAKHAPASKAQVDLAISPAAAVLRVVLPAGEGARRGPGAARDTPTPKSLKSYAFPS